MRRRRISRCLKCRNIILLFSNGAVLSQCTVPIYDLPKIAAVSWYLATLVDGVRTRLYYYAKRRNISDGWVFVSNFHQYDWSQHIALKAECDDRSCSNGLR
jgi:hypothetical protein